MATAPDTPCLSELGALLSRNKSVITQPCNQSTVKIPHYSPQATAAIAVSITFMMIVTIVGNILVIIAVLTSRSLKGAQNLFLVSLAAADILVATLIIPFSLANELQGHWAFSSLWCEIYLALDVLFCTSSIVHLCAIALDRYLSISRPVSYGTKRTPKRIKAAIVIVWLISAVISFPPLLTLDKSEGGEEVCELNDERWYILYSTIGSFFAPCVIMILVYIRIYQIAKKHTRCPPGKNHKPVPGSAAAHEHVQRAAEAGQQNGDKQDFNGSQQQKVLNKITHLDSTLTSQSKMLVNITKQDAQQNPNSSTAAILKSPSSPSIPQHDSQILSAVPPKDVEEDKADKVSGSGPEVELQMGGKINDDEEEEKETPTMKTSEQGLVFSRTKGFKIHVLNLACRYKHTMATQTGSKVVVEESPNIQGTPTSRRKAMVNREKRFTFVLAVVMGVFVICWFPFFFTYSLQAVCPETCTIPNPLFKFFFWIGYCNSCLNPVIYTIFNKDFRRAFKRILCRDTKGTFF
ncbi:alpha-2A adrenergic receptor [Boleophthalmus pectinirostris]|uniref:alpha-2A adrenergic receptor n=1 Tax=Boleophthalmus pectinirostris TaxID=150288 RepID=UPI0024317DE0|nr:alpha-2A adrenergic receptor [Boleophthalmus pectinirostris]